MSGWPISSQLFRVFSHASIAQLIALELSKSGNGRLLDDLDCGPATICCERTGFHFSPKSFYFLFIGSFTDQLFSSISGFGGFYLVVQSFDKPIIN